MTRLLASLRQLMVSDTYRSCSTYIAVYMMYVMYAYVCVCIRVYAGGAAAVSPSHQARAEDITMVESDISSHHDLPLPGGELDFTAPTEADLDIFDRLGQGQGLTDQLAPGVTEADMLGTDILEGHFYEECV